MYGSFDGVLTRWKPVRTMIGSGDMQVATLDVTSVFLTDASALIDAYLGVRYSTPVPETALITMISCDLALFNMVVEKLPEVPDFMQGRYDRAIKTLEKLACGELAIASATVLGSADNFAWSSTQGYHPVFSPVAGEVYETPDKDRVEADQDERVDDEGEAE
jgi:phage gp36-like protein